VYVPTRRGIVASKLTGPPLRPGIVDRPLLLQGLVSATHVPVMLVSAPAGYGKTTLLALWRERDQRPFAWVSLDGADNDPVRLVASLAAALDPILGLDAAIADSLKAPEPPLEEVVLPSLVDACVEAGQPLPRAGRPGCTWPCCRCGTARTPRSSWTGSRARAGTSPIS
jgi:LuxR family maltose regulon positive regulatory protein